MKVHPLGSEMVGKVGLCVTIFELSEIRCRLEFQICVKGAPSWFRNARQGWIMCGHI